MAPELGVSEARVGYLVTGYAVASFLAATPLTAALRGLPRRPELIGALLGSQPPTPSPRCRPRTV
ncbi:hypothetical protein [Streptomyces sp. GESEQ-35]|uniref:hypothetical protein n=1 Tax=Streptomyces sp. GESEQ-35 TaxID=2812657 RepID=UPI001FF54B69|nr:hypothetical protein [Streptomyces sp. GESEQ-35]